jgi:3-oxoacyl-[acyl-carrier protein] reductase
VELTIEDFMLPVTTVLKSRFITARAAARRMVEQRSGVIVPTSTAGASGKRRST